jgi:hypothetical protein
LAEGVGDPGAGVSSVETVRERSKFWVCRVLVLTIGGEMVRLVWP